MKLIRRLLAFGLAAMLVMSCASALADFPTVDFWGTPWEGMGSSAYTDGYLIVGNGTDYHVKVERVDANGNVTLAGYVDLQDPDANWVYDDDIPGNYGIWVDFFLDEGGYISGDANPGHFYANGIGIVHRLIVTDADGNRKVYPFFVNYDGNDIKLTEASWMWENTVCSFGPHFSDVDPELTDKWYTFTPVDLSQDGVQAFSMVAGGKYKIGTVFVIVEGDNVTVDYRYVNPTEIYNLSEFFTIFQDFDSITTVNPDELQSMEYGKTYSISGDLGGATNVLLFTCNKANYLNSTTGVTRFFENIPARVEAREAMLELAGLAEAGEAAE